MMKIKANLKLYQGVNKRKTPFFTKYRPLFEFTKESKVSGQINLIDQKEFRPGDDGIVEVVFVNLKYLGNDFKVGKTFSFFEAKEPLGEGVILEVYQ